MKLKTLAITALLCTSTSAFAGGMAEPIMEPIVIEDEAGTSGSIVVPLLLLAVIAAVASRSGGCDDCDG